MSWNVHFYLHFSPLEQHSASCKNFSSNLWWSSWAFKGPETSLMCVKGTYTHEQHSATQSARAWMGPHYTRMTQPSLKGKRQWPLVSPMAAGMSVQFRAHFWVQFPSSLSTTVRSSWPTATFPSAKGATKGSSCFPVGKSSLIDPFPSTYRKIQSESLSFPWPEARMVEMSRQNPTPREASNVLFLM